MVEGEARVSSKIHFFRKVVAIRNRQHIVSSSPPRPVSVLIRTVCQRVGAHLQQSLTQSVRHLLVPLPWKSSVQQEDYVV